jgi:AraC-like DNA-binding protein
MSAPTDDQLRTAIMWLESNEGDDGPDGERSNCIAVAIYLEKLLFRRTAREAGVSPSYLRRIMAERSKATDVVS